MKRLLPVVAVLCVVGLGLYLFSNRSPRTGPGLNGSSATANMPNGISSMSVPPHPAAGAAESKAPAASSPVSAVTPTTAAAASPPPVTSDPEYTDIPPAAVLEHVRSAVQLYGQTFGGNPVGTNPEITQALNGGNPKQIKFLRPDAGMRINGNGELIDSWGTPFFFHQLSGSQTEIRSAGPDRKMWTSDDLVIE